MGWDDDETVLDRAKLKWLQDQASARQATKARNRRFDYVHQLYGLCMKNIHLRVSLGLYFFPLVVILPALAVGTLALIDTTTNVPPVIDLSTADFFSLGFSPTSSIIKCAVFEPLRGSAIGGAWCSPMLYAPAKNAGVREVMDEVAKKNSWTTRVLSDEEAERSTLPGGCSPTDCMLGFSTMGKLSEWLKLNPGRSATAIVFVDLAEASAGALVEQGGNVLPSRTAFEVWYNESALPLYVADGADRLASFNESSALIIAAQHAVEEALLSTRLNGASVRVHYRRYPRLRTGRYWDVQRMYGLLMANIPVSLHAVGLLVQIVAEKELGLVAVLRSLGMFESTYWLSLYIQHAVEAAIMASCMYAMGVIVRLPMFVMVDFFVWFAGIWLFGMAACGTACFVSLFTTRRATASALGGVGVLCATFIALWPSSADVQFASLLIDFQDPYYFDYVDTGVLEFIYPPFAFLKLVFDVTQLTARVQVLDPATGLTTYQAAGSYTADDLWTGNYGLGRFDSRALGDPSVPNDQWTYELRPTADSLSWLALRVVVSFALTWWLGQVMTGGHGRGRHPLFFMSPTFWFPPAPRGNPSLLASLRLRGDYDQFTHLDVDVAAEAYAVLGGNLPDEKAVVLYDVSKLYSRSRVPAVRELSLSLEEHELFALLGRNGAGKSTVVKMLTTNNRISKGDMILYGASVENDLDVVRSMIGVCPQEDVLHGALTSAQTLYLFGRFNGISRQKLRARVAEALLDVNLAQVSNKRAHAYSGGMKRRLSLACAYIGEPRVVALDEPTTGMDPYNRKRVWDMIISKKLHGRTTLLTTHSMEEAEVLAHTVGIMAEGQLVALGSAPHLKRRFGAGYTIKLVTRRGDMLALQAKVTALLPEIELVDVSASACTYAIAEERMSRASKLLRFIETLKKESDDWLKARAPADEQEATTPRGGRQLLPHFALEALEAFESPRRPSDGAHVSAHLPGGAAHHAHGGSRQAGAVPPPPIILKDWLVTHTSLEEVFVRLARQRHSNAAPGAHLTDMANGLAADDASGAVGSLGDVTEAAPGAEDLFSAFTADAPAAEGEKKAKAKRNERQLRAAALKNLALYRRRPVRQCINFWFSGGLVALVYVLQIFLVDQPALSSITNSQLMADKLRTACGNITDAFDAACEDRVSLADEVACSMCTQPDWPSFEACCIDKNYSRANGCIADHCVGQPGDVDYVPPDWSSDCAAKTVGGVTYPRPYCECKGADGKRSEALQARIDRTPICAAFRRQVELNPAAMPVYWVPTSLSPGALDLALNPPGVVDDRRMAWLGWRVPVFGADLGSVVSKLADEESYLGKRSQPIWGEPPTFPALDTAQASRGAERGLTPGQLSAAESLRDQIDATGLLARFPRALARTSFQTSSGQPSSSCSAVKAATKCCYETELVNFGSYDFGKEVDVCSSLGSDCPERDLAVATFLQRHLGWTEAEVKADRNVNISEQEDSVRLAIGSTADFEGRGTLCAGDVPPICAAVYAADPSVNVTCEEVRLARQAYLPLVNSTEVAWNGSEWDDDASWECVEAQCVEYETFLVPAYTKGGWKSQGELNEHVLKEQAKILGNVYKDASAVESGTAASTQLNVAERLFPSWSVDVLSLDLGNATVDFTITSFFKRVANGFFYVTEPLGDAAGRTNYDVRQQNLARPHALEGQNQLAKTVPAMLQNAFVNAILQERNGDADEIRVGSRPMPELLREVVPYRTALIVDAMSIAALPAACMVMLPQMTYALVQDKEYKVRMLMSMMGMPHLSYWLVEWAFASLNSHLFMLFFWVLGTYILRLTSFTRSKSALLLLLQVWAQLQVGLAILISTPFHRTTWAAIAATLLVLGSLASGATIYVLSLQELDNAPVWFELYDLWPPFAFFHCLWLVIRVQVSVEDLYVFSTDVGFAFRLLIIHIAWVFPLAMYLDAILPREFGIPESPFFCLRPEFYLRTLLKLAGGVPRKMPGSQCLQGCMPRLVAALKAVERGAEDARKSLSRDSVEEMIEKDGKKEDADVRQERERVERALYDPQALVQIFSLHKAYRDRVALHNLTLKVEQDECFGLLGPNGAGKTTTISVLTGLYPPTKGNALIAGHDILRQMPQIYKSIGVCPQFDILWPDLTVRDHLLFYARVKGVPVATEAASVYTAALNVGLEGSAVHLLDRVVSQLSAGQKRRVSLAISLLGTPDVIFLDEPTTGLDPESRRVVWQVIENSKSGRAIMLTTHAMEEADLLCTRIGILANGALRALGTNVHLKNKYGDGYKIDISFMPSAQERLSAFVKRVLPTAELDSSRSWTGNRMYKVRREDVSLARLFHLMDTRPDSIGIIHWGVRQTSLEEVFLIITSDFELQVDGSEALIKTPRQAALALRRRARGFLSALVRRQPKSVADGGGITLELPPHVRRPDPVPRVVLQYASEMSMISSWASHGAQSPRGSEQIAHTPRSSGGAAPRARSPSAARSSRRSFGTRRAGRPAAPLPSPPPGQERV